MMINQITTTKIYIFIKAEINHCRNNFNSPPGVVILYSFIQTKHRKKQKKTMLEKHQP